MILFRQAKDLQDHLREIGNKTISTGFVPTMGALHHGHISLVATCKEQSDVGICSIFVNPTQFNDPKDFEKYPITIGEDILKLEKAGCDILFMPSVEEMYPSGTTPSSHYNLGLIEKILEGKYRPGHFQGVCQVVERLLRIVQPDKLFMGQKDYQQVLVIKRLIDLLQLKLELVVGKTIREPTGLAMSSRNMRLNETEKEQALRIYKCLKNIKDQYKEISFDKLVEETKEHLLKAGFSKVDYVSISDANTLHPLGEYEAGTKHIALVAAFIGNVRLIDNMILDE